MSDRQASPFVVVATQGRRDLQGLKAALALAPQGLWFVASARKAGVLLENLVASGEDPAAVARIVAPAGDFMGAQTPEEIALSVLTSVVAARRGHAPQVKAARDTPLGVGVSQAAAESLASEAVPAAAAGSCCGGSAKKAVPAGAQAQAMAVSTAASPPVAPAVSPVATSAPSSCCGG